jgi:hypothetical protein
MEALNHLHGLDSAPGLFDQSLHPRLAHVASHALPRQSFVVNDQYSLRLSQLFIR